MKLLADRDERFKGLFAKVAILILLAAVGVALNLLFSGINKGLFSPKASIYFIVGSGQDVKVGMPVKLSGFKIGSVKGITLDNKAQAQVEMSIEKQYLPLLKDDAVVRLKKEGVIGDSILEARRGTEGGKQLSAGATIQFESSGGLEQIAQDLRDRLFPALDEVNHLLQDANDPQGDVRQVLKNLREISFELRGARERIGHLLGQVDEGVVNDVRPLLRSARQSAENAELITVKVAQEVPLLINKADASLENLRQSSEIIKSAVENSAPQLPGLLREGRGMVIDTRNILGSASTSWPLKNIMPPPDQGLLKMDSHD